MTSVWCFQCGSEYVEDVLECLECGVPTTDEKPMPADEVGSEDEDQLAYDLHEWSGEGRSVLRGMLVNEGLSHSFQGATLIVREADEAEIDVLVRNAEIRTMPTLDKSKETMVYELDEFDDVQRTRLGDRLAEETIAHEFDARGDLVVYEENEEAVDEIFEALDEEPDEEYVFGDGIDGVDGQTVVSDLFLSVNRLKRNITDHKGVLAFVDAADLVPQLELPFGYSSAVWRDVVDRTATLHAAFVDDEGREDGELQEQVGELYEILRPLV